MTSIYNVITVDKEFVKPEVGASATMLLWTDRHAYTITRVSASGKTFWMKRDKAKLKEGCSPWKGNEDYDYEPDPSATETKVMMGKRGWKSGGNKVWVGVRDEHYDPNF